MERLTAKYRDYAHYVPVCSIGNTASNQSIYDKLGVLEDALEEGYINCCPECGSFRVAMEQGVYDSGGYMKKYTDCACNDCGKRW